MPLDTIWAEVNNGSLGLVYVLCLEVVRIQIIPRSILSIDKIFSFDFINILRENILFFFCKGCLMHCRIHSNDYGYWVIGHSSSRHNLKTKFVSPHCWKFTGIQNYPHMRTTAIAIPNYIKHPNEAALDDNVKTQSVGWVLTLSSPKCQVNRWV